MELTNTNRSRAYPDRLGMDVEKIQKRISVFSFEGMIKGRQVKNLSFLSYRNFVSIRQKRSARIVLRRNGRMSLSRPDAGGESCFAGFYYHPVHSGAPLHEQKELRSSGKYRRCEFANGACERTDAQMSLREDRTASERKDVAVATRRSAHEWRG